MFAPCHHHHVDFIHTHFLSFFSLLLLFLLSLLLLLFLYPKIFPVIREFIEPLPADRGKEILPARFPGCSSAGTRSPRGRNSGGMEDLQKYVQ